MKMEDMLKPENICARRSPRAAWTRWSTRRRSGADFIKDTTKTVEEIIKEATAEIGEKSRRRLRNLGEGIEKRNEDFAAEVAAQMGK